MTTRDELISELRWKKFPVTSDGFVCLVDVMGSDASITQAARVSYGKDVRDVLDQQSEKKDNDLIRYLMRHRHTTPFEMCELKFLVRVPMDCWRQWIRHRMASVNEYSTRYTEAIDSRQTTKPDEWRSQATNNKQGSGDYLDESIGAALSVDEANFHHVAQVLYQSRLDHGVAKEQARKDLPLSNYTIAYWKIDLHNLFHFLSLRMDSHAQQEIRDYATTIGYQIVKPLFPLAWQAFVDYRLNAMTLSGPEVAAMSEILNSGLTMPDDMDIETPLLEMGFSKREVGEFIAKLHKFHVYPAQKESDK